MKRYRFFYEQLVTGTEVNNAFDAAQNAELNKSTELGEAGIHSGFGVAPTSPISTGVQVAPGTARIPSTGRRVENLISQTVACDVTEGGDPTYSDLGIGEGRWCTIYVRSILVDSNLRTDGHGIPLYYEQDESLQFFINRGTAGVVANKDSLARPGSVSTALILTDIWFANGSTDIAVGDLDDSRREDYFREVINGVDVVAGNPRVAIQSIGTQLVDLSSADLPTGAADGAHRVGLGGHASQPEWQWGDTGGGSYLNASGNTVHDVVAKIVSDLGKAQGQGVAGARLVAADTTPPAWYGGSSLGVFGDYDGSIMGAVVAVVRDLEDGGGGGSTLIASDSYTSGSTYDLTGVSSVQGHLQECIDNLNDHVNTAGHPASAITYAGSPAFPDTTTLPAASVEATFDTLVSVLGQTSAVVSTAGTSKIGTNQVTGTFDGLSLTAPGSSSLDTQLIAIMTAVATAVQVTGDARLQGTLTPKTDNTIGLGDSAHNFTEIHTRKLASDTGTLIIAAQGGFGLALTSQAAASWVSNGLLTLDGDPGVAFSEAGALVATINQAALYPATGGFTDIGLSSARWKIIYANGADFSGGTPVKLSNLSHVELYDTCLIRDMATRVFKTCIHCSKFQPGAAGGWVVDSAGDYTESKNATDNAFFALDTLRPGQAISRIEVLWRGTGIGNLTCRLMRTSFATGTTSQIGTFDNTTSLTITPDGANIAHTVVDGYAYYIEVESAAIGQRVYAIEIQHTNPKWPL